MAPPPVPAPGTLTTFSLFNKLPTELRLRIYKISIIDFLRSDLQIVCVRWDPRERAFLSNRKVPPLLHTCQESRSEAQRIWQLRFASSPELARVYFSYEHDIMLLDGNSLGPAPGRLGRKMMKEECENVRNMMVHEEFLLLHANDQMRELERFKGLKVICVLCDPDNVEFGDEFGGDDILEMAFTLDESPMDDESRTETWPELVCLRHDDDLPACSRHWWFDGWNQRSTVLQKEKWPETLATSLNLTKEDDDGPEQFLLNLLYMQDTPSP